MELHVISFNIRSCSDPNGNAIAERAPRLHAVTAKHDADVIGFQEFTPEWEEYIEAYYSAEYDMFYKYRSHEIDIEASPILWKKDRFACLDHGYFWLSDTPEVESRGWDEVYNCFRMCVYVVLQDKETGERFVFMNTHFGFGDKGQVSSAELIYQYYQKVSAYPTILVGDFNMTPDSPGYTKMCQHFTDVNMVTAKDLRSTYHGYDPENIRDKHIDYCFINHKVTPICQNIMDDLVDGKFPSDHYGLFLKLKF